MVEYHHPVIRKGTVRVDLAPPPFLQTCSEVGEERDEFSPIKLPLPEEVRERIFFFFVVVPNYMCNIYRYVHLFTDVQVSSKSPSVGGCAEQPQQGQGGRALNQPKP